MVTVNTQRGKLQKKVGGYSIGSKGGLARGGGKKTASKNREPAEWCQSVNARVRDYLKQSKNAEGKGGGQL